MKKILSLFLALVAVLSLVSCKEEEPRTYVVDGEFTAYVAHDNDGPLQLTWVTVTIENDEIKSFYIDQLQSKNGQWNEKTKKELGYAYRMHQQWDLSEDEYKAYLKENSKLEWFEQVDALAAAWLGGANVSNISSVTGVTISDSGYSKVLAALLSEGWTR